MTALHFLIIIVIIFCIKMFCISAESHEVKVEKITIKKCCPLGEYIYKRKTCEYFEDSLDFNELKLYDGLYDGDMYLTGRSLKDVYELDAGVFDVDRNFRTSAIDYSRIGFNIYLTETGILYLEIPNEVVRWRHVNNSNFCVDYLLSRDRKNPPTLHFWAILPMETEDPKLDPLYITIGMLTSCVFLALVLVVYSLLPELRNLTGLVLMAYVSSFFSSFLFLAVLQIGNTSPLGCQLLTYFCYFSFLASFCWMNVMAYDIWWTFRGFAKARPIHRFGEWFKFKVYCAYAFGVPLAMTVFLVTVNHVPMRHLPWFVTPNVPKRGCFLGEDAKLRYLYAPMMILILLNWLFFLMTSFEIWSLHRQTAILDTAAAGTPAAHRQHRARLLLYLKLSIIMGVNWVLEVISSFTPNLHIWIITDAYNFLIGISIFLIFVCKRKILRKLKKRYRDWRDSGTGYVSNRSHSSHTTSSDVTKDMPLQVCPHPDAPSKHRFVERRYEFN